MNSISLYTRRRNRQYEWSALQDRDQHDWFQQYDRPTKIHAFRRVLRRKCGHTRIKIIVIIIIIIIIIIITIIANR